MPRSAWSSRRARLRRLAALGVALLLPTLACATAGAPAPAARPGGGAIAAELTAADAAFLDTLERRTFDWFWDTTNPRNGMTPDRWPEPPFASIAAVGFALTAYPIGVERGWVTRDAAAERTLATLRHFWAAPQGEAPAGAAGRWGYFYHFLDMETGLRSGTTELSTIDTALLMGGVLLAQQYFDRGDGREAEIRALADSLYRRVEWDRLQVHSPLVTMAWRPERGFGPAQYEGYDEAMLLYVLALGSPTHPATAAAWPAFTRTYRWAEFHGFEHVNFAPLFGHQYSHVWIDFRGIRDAYMRGRGIDYSENSRRATLAQRAYAAANPMGWRGYSADVWGLTASDGPGGAVTATVNGETRRMQGYWARGAAAGDVRDDGTIAPTAAGGSIPFAPRETVRALRTMRATYGDDLFGRYGFLDAFNPTLTDTAATPRAGRIVAGKGWFDDQHLGIDQGPIVAMIANQRDGMIWRLMQRSPYVVKGLCRAGFTGGWIEGRCDAGDLAEAAAAAADTLRAAAYAGELPGGGVATARRPRDAAMDRFVDSVLATLTLEEKLGQLNQYRGRYGLTGPQTPEAGEADIRAGRVGSFLGVHGAELTREMQRVAVEESRTRIPLLFAHDVIHGFRTIFPVSLAEAASWDAAAVQRAARVAGMEAAAHGLHWTFAPMVDIARDPRWGRIVEGAGEDPYLGSVMAAARVRGFQGGDLRDTLTILATAKHFVGYGAAEGGRDYNIAEIPERTLWEVYMPPFQAALNAGARSVMAAFNEVDGVPMHAHRSLIDGALRDRWGWDGILVSDYTGVMELLHHGIAADSAEAGRLALDAGVDVDMVSNIFYKDLPPVVRSGRLPMAVVDSAVRRVLRAKWELGLFEDPYRYSSVERERALTLAPQFVAEAREMARKSIVLLKNEGNVLPLSKGVRTVAVIGPLADDARSALGSWAAAGRAEDAVTPLAGIRAALPDARVLHARGASVDSMDRSGFAEAVRIARQADAVILVLGEHQDMSAEARNRAWIDLPGVQRELAEAVQAAGKPTVAVLMNGRPLAIPWLAEHVPAIVEAWYLGVQTGPALADVLFGDAVPGGKLPVTFPRTVGQVPIYYNHKNTGRPSSVTERYTSKYIDVEFTPLYPFGHGLSYTTFEHAAPTLGATSIAMGDSITITATVANTGRRAGDEVVQLYLRDDVASVTRPVKMLKRFERVTLQPGERRTVTFTLRPNDLALYDRAMRRVVEPGTFTVWVGTSSADDARPVRFTVTGEVTEVPDLGPLAGTGLEGPLPRSGR